MKKVFTLLTLLLTFLGQVTAQQKPAHHPGQPDGFDQYLHTKCDMVVHELGLSPKDSARFIPIYHELQAEKSKLFRKYGGSRRVRMAISAGQTVADSTLLRIIHNNAQLQVEDAQLEQRFMARFLSVLTPLQFYKLQQAEQKFKTEMVKRANTGKK